MIKGFQEGKYFSSAKTSKGVIGVFSSRRGVKIALITHVKTYDCYTKPIVFYSMVYIQFDSKNSAQLYQCWVAVLFVAALCEKRITQIASCSFKGFSFDEPEPNIHLSSTSLL